MKNVISVALLILLSGCDLVFWSHDQVTNAANACEAKGGISQMGTNRDGRVLSMWCRFESGERYPMNTKGEF